MWLLQLQLDVVSPWLQRWKSPQLQPQVWELAATTWGCDNDLTPRPIDGQSWAKPLRQIVSVFLYLWQPNKNSHNILIHFNPFWMSICSTFRRPTRQHPTAPVGTSQASLVHRFGQVKDPEVVLEAVRQEKWPQPREFFFPYLICGIARMISFKFKVGL